jgi:hypothetical protein
MSGSGSGIAVGVAVSGTRSRLDGFRRDYEALNALDAV